MIQELGWVINFKKSELTPTQKFDFLGYRFDLSKGKVSPTEKKWIILTNEQEGSGSLRQFHISILPQQARGDPFSGNVSYDMVPDGILQPQGNFAKGSTHPGLSECDSRQSFTQGQGHTDRVVSSSQNFQRICHIWHRPMVDMFATKLPLYISPVPDPNAMPVDALNISWEAMDGYAYCPIALIPKVVKKMRTYACQMIVVAPGWSGMSWFWDLIQLSTKAPQFLPHWEFLLKQPFSQRFHQNHPYLNLHVSRFETKSPQKFSISVAERIKAPQRFSSRRV